MELNIKINLDNAAFRDEENNLNRAVSYVELMKIFIKLTDRFIEGCTIASIKDLNGNTVGEWSITEQDLGDEKILDRHFNKLRAKEAKKGRK